jgi:RNA ligase (TIGR02306 family)
VEVKRISRINEHPNADKLELGSVEGLDYQFAVQKGIYSIGDKVVYFPVDSVIPQNIKEIFELKNLSGPLQNRVKTIKLRYEFSQGLVLPFEKFISFNLLNENTEVNSDVTDILNITKYEPDPIEEKNCILLPLVDGQSLYDIESTERYSNVLEYMMDKRVVVMEKLEGVNFAISLNNDGIHICQRNYKILEKDNCTHPTWDVVRNNNYIELIHSLHDIYKPSFIITLYGELIGPGIAKNYYDLKDKTVKFFDIKVDGKFVNYDNFKKSITDSAPVLSESTSLREVLSNKTITEFSNGKSVINPNKLREGVVVKLYTEEYYEGFGRTILKKRSPQYLYKYDT